MRGREEVWSREVSRAQVLERSKLEGRRQGLGGEWKETRFGRRGGKRSQEETVRLAGRP